MFCISLFFLPLIYKSVKIIIDGFIDFCENFYKIPYLIYKENLKLWNEFGLVHCENHISQNENKTDSLPSIKENDDHDNENIKAA